MMLFNYSSVKPTTSPSPTGSHRSPVPYTWQWRKMLLGIIPHNLFGCFFTPCTSRFALIVYGCIYSINIDNDPLSNEPPVMTKLTDPIGIKYFTRSLGYTRAIAIAEDALLIRYGHLSEGGLGPATFILKHLECDPPVGNLLIDEDSGRAVISGYRQMTVIDFASAFY